MRVCKTHYKHSFVSVANAESDLCAGEANWTWQPTQRHGLGDRAVHMWILYGPAADYLEALEHDGHNGISDAPDYQLANAPREFGESNQVEGAALNPPCLGSEQMKIHHKQLLICGSVMEGGE